MTKYRCTAFQMHGCMRNPLKETPLICCSHCSKKGDCKYACVNNPKKCGMGKECDTVEEPNRSKQYNAKTRTVKSVKAVNPDTGETIAVYESVKSAAEAKFISPDAIYSAIRFGKVLVGSKWQYVHKKYEG